MALAARNHKERSQPTREAILRAAEAVFADEGYDRARLEDIARRVGIRRASLLYHFRDKPSVYAAVIDELFGELAQRYHRILQGTGAIAIRLEQVIDEWVDFAAERPALVRIMIREMADGVSEHSRPFAERSMPPLMAILEAIVAGQAQRKLRAFNPMHFVMVVSGASAFFLLGGALVTPGTAERFRIETDREEHRRLLRALVRRLMGTRGPRPVKASRSKKNIRRVLA